MTISLLHYNPKTKLAASISATGGVSVGGYVNHSWRGVGCCATQGLLTNPWYPEKVKQALINNKNSEEIVQQLMQEDDGFEQRQCLIIDQHGAAAVMNGTENVPYIGALLYQDIAIAGNMLVGADVLEMMVEYFIHSICDNAVAVLEDRQAPIYKNNYESWLPEALIKALGSAIKQGGDKRGSYSASLRIESMDTAPIDIRVDWSDDCLIQDMQKVLKQVKSDGFQTFLSQLPTK